MEKPIFKLIKERGAAEILYVLINFGIIPLQFLSIFYERQSRSVDWKILWSYKKVLWSILFVFKKFLQITHVRLIIKKETLKFQCDTSKHSTILYHGGILKLTFRWRLKKSFRVVYLKLTSRNSLIVLSVFLWLICVPEQNFNSIKIEFSIR